MTQKEISGFPDIIAAEFLQVSNIQQIELCGDNLYMIKDNTLYRHDGLIQISANSLRKQTVPKGKLLYIYSLSGNLFLVMQESYANMLYKMDNDEWQKCSKNSPTACGGYVCYENWLAVFYTSLVADNYLFAIDAFGRSMRIRPALDFKSINFIKFLNHDLFIALHNPNKVIRISAKELVTAFQNNEPEYITQYDLVMEYLCFNMIEDETRILFAPDGGTTLVDQEQNTIFSDEQKGQSGFQIAASGLLDLKNTYQILGSWRRNEEHPLTCFYILKKGKQLYKSTPDVDKTAAIKPWTGFNCFRKDQKGSALVFSCAPKGAVLVRSFASWQEFSRHMGQENMRLAFHNDNLMLYKGGFPEARHITEKVAPTLPYVTPVEPSNLYITIDVEQHIKGKPYCLTGEDLDCPCGVYYIMDILEKHGLKGIFFVNIYEHVNFDGKIEEIVGAIHKRGHEVGLHCHPSAHPFNLKVLTTYDTHDQRTIIKYGIDFIKNITGSAPFSFRGGGYAINNDTLTVLAEEGIGLDSSVFLTVSQDVKYKSKNSLAFYGSLAELPVTCIMANGSPSKIDVNWSGSARKMLEQITACHNYGLKNIVMMLHSFSFLDFTKNQKEAVAPFQFTARRYIKGVKKNLMGEFEKFCAQIGKISFARPLTFRQARENGLLDQQTNPGPDNIPLLPLSRKQEHICPVCGEAVSFLPYRSRKNALCPNCRVLERMRFKMHYLKKTLNIENCDPLKILHFGPALNIQKILSALPQHDYITADPYNDAHFKFPIENIPFENNHFDLVLCIAVLIHVLDDHKAIAEMARVLKPGGELLLWLGTLSEANTIETYDRNDFDRMTVGDTSYPDQLDAAKTREENGKILYNPRFRTRKYGRDVLELLANNGFEVRQIRAGEYMDYNKYGVKAEDLLLSCIKK